MSRPSYGNTLNIVANTVRANKDILNDTGAVVLTFLYSLGAKDQNQDEVRTLC